MTTSITFLLIIQLDQTLKVIEHSTNFSTFFWPCDNGRETTMVFWWTCQITNSILLLETTVAKLVVLLYNLGFYGISVSKLCHPFFGVVCCSLLFPIFPIFGAKIQSKLYNEEPSIASVFKGIIEYPSAPSTVFENHKKSLIQHYEFTF